MNATEFFLKYNKKFLDYDGLNGNQCVDVTKQYFKDVLELPPFQGNAYDYWTNIPGFQKIARSWFNTPKPGDIVIWKPTASNIYGHIAICNWVRMLDFGAFEQNNPIGSPCHYQIHNYQGVVGWLRPLNPPAEAPRPVPVSSPQEPVNIKMVYLSDTDDIGPQVAYCNSKLKEFTNNILGVEYVFKQIPPVNAPPGFDLEQTEASNIVEINTYDKPFHWVVLGYYGQNTSPGYFTATSFNKNIWYTSGYKVYPKEVLLFELKHFAVKFYNQHRGSNPYIENYDNYKSADGGLAKVEEQIKEISPYLSVFKL